MSSGPKGPRGRLGGVPRDITLRAEAYATRIDPPFDSDDIISAYESGSMDQKKLSSNNTKERIIAAAYKLKPEYICNKGGIYQTHTRVRDDIYQCRIGRHHAEILHIFGNEIDHETDGFYTSYGRWVDRKEAAKIALECGQITKLHYWNDRLDSSDVFDYDENDNLI